LAKYEWPEIVPLVFVIEKINSVVVFSQSGRFTNFHAGTSRQLAATPNTFLSKLFIKLIYLPRLNISVRMTAGMRGLHGIFRSIPGASSGGREAGSAIPSAC
jgi:hypothetical protein